MKLQSWSQQNGAALAQNKLEPCLAWQNPGVRLEPEPNTPSRLDLTS